MNNTHLLQWTISWPYVYFVWQRQHGRGDMSPRNGPHQTCPIIVDMCGFPQLTCRDPGGEMSRQTTVKMVKLRDSTRDCTFTTRVVVQWIYITLHLQSGTKLVPEIVRGSKCKKSLAETTHDQFQEFWVVLTWRKIKKTSKYAHLFPSEHAHVHVLW